MSRYRFTGYNIDFKEKHILRSFMGINTKLYINREKFSAEDIKRVVTRVVTERYGKQEIELKYVSGGYYFTIDYKESEESSRMLSLFFNEAGQHIGIKSHMLSLSAHGDAVEFLKQIAKITGGVFTSNDCNDEYETFEDPFDGNLDFLVKMLQVTGNSEYKEEIIKSLNKLGGK